MTSALRIMNRLLAVTGAALLITLIIVLSVPIHTAINATRFERASLCADRSVDTPFSQAGLNHLLSAAPTPDCDRSVMLPYRSAADGIQLTRSSVGHMARAWYRFRYDVPARWKTDDQLMIYSPRVLGVAWQARVNDQVVADNLDDWRMTWNRPIAVRLDSAHFRPGDQLTIAVGIAFEPQVGHALARVSVGPAQALAQRLAVREFLQFVMPVACSVTLLAMGVFFLLFWSSRRVERTHLFLALSCIAWCVCNLQYALPRRDDPVLNSWYSAVAGPSISWVMWLIYLFVLQLDSRFSRVIALIMPPFVLIMTVLALPIIPLNENVGTFPKLSCSTRPVPPRPDTDPPTVYITGGLTAPPPPPPPPLHAPISKAPVSRVRLATAPTRFDFMAFSLVGIKLLRFAHWQSRVP
jgi:hypothetical protein